MRQLRFPLLATALRGVIAVAPRGFSALADADDEERLAQFLVQDGSAPAAAFPCASPTARVEGPLARAKPATSSSNSNSSGDAAISMAMAMTAATETPLPNALVTPSRRANDHLSKYAHVRQQMHTQQLADGTMMEPAREWMCCGCRTYNFIGRKTCRRCKQKDTESFKHHYPPARHTPLFPAVWLCHACGHTNQSDGKNAHTREKFFCGGCGERFHGVREWYCPSCNHINSRASIQCATCLSARPHEWTCTTCRHDKNSVFFTECRRCHSTRRRLVSDSTVLCFACQQRNDVQWEMCFACMAPLGLMNTVRKMTTRLDNVECINELADSKLSALPEDSAASKDNDSRKDTDAPKDTAARLDSAVSKDSAASKDSDSLKDSDVRKDSDSRKDSAAQKDSDARKDSDASKDIDSPKAIDTVKECASPNVSDGIKETNAPNESDACETPAVSTDPSLAASPPPVETEDGAWWCAECEVLQRRNAVFCDICLRPKSTAATRPASFSSPSHATSGEWRCPYCRRHAPATATSCCGEAREVPGGYWQCAACCSVNRDARSRCLGCAAPPPAAPWRCFACRQRNSAELLECARCAGPHPHHWQCAACGCRCQHAADRRCWACAAEKPRSTAVACGFCAAPNHPARRACHRCRARLTPDLWACAKCGAAANARLDRRCATCGEPRAFNPREETWVCDVCDTAVASGGDLPVHEQCPRCGAARSERSLCMPSRWRCRSCGVANPCAAAACGECGARRLLEGLRSSCSCPSCFRLTRLDERECCEACGGDLARVVSEAGSPISLKDLTDHTVSGIYGATAHHNNMDGKDDEAAVSLSSIGKVMGNSLNRHENCVTQTKQSENDMQGIDVLDNVLWDDDGAASSMKSYNMTYDECEDEEDIEEDQVGDKIWADDIPSWLCANCETTNLEEAEVCISCDIPRGTD